MLSYYKDSKIGIIEFNDPGSRINVLSRENLEILTCIIDGILEGNSHISAMFFISKKQGIFIAGADIKELARIRTKKEARLFCKKGQDLFNKIESLKIPTFVVVDGACVGGGLELALSCDYIIATKTKRVKFALPEIKLGITPGFGGVRRLEERIGQKYTQDLVGRGTFIDAKEAKRLNLVDKIISRQTKSAYKRLTSSCKRKKRLRNSFTTQEIKKRDELDKLERNLLSEKIFQKPAKNALTSYLLVDKYKTNILSGQDIKKVYPIERAIIMGAGTMGRDIAYLMSKELNLQINIDDINRSVLKNARIYIKKIYSDAIEKGLLLKSEARARFRNISFGKGNLKDSDIVIESITEDLLAKKDLFAKIEKKLRKDTILATNTSCLPIEELSKSLIKADRFLGVHFFNPAYKMKLVEVVPSRHTSKEVLGRAVLFLQKMNRTPIIVKDRPGFLVNRMLLPYLNEAIFMLEEGYNKDDIETTMLEFGMPVGPIRLSKDIGLDVLYKAGKVLEDSFGKRMKVPDIVREDAKNILDIERKRYNGNNKRSSSKDIVKRLLSPMTREKNLCLKEGIVDNREVIDLALLLGIGFPRRKRI